MLFCHQPPAGAVVWLLSRFVGASPCGLNTFLIIFDPVGVYNALKGLYILG